MYPPSPFLTYYPFKLSSIGITFPSLQWKFWQFPLASLLSYVICGHFKWQTRPHFVSRINVQLHIITIRNLVLPSGSLSLLPFFPMFLLLFSTSPKSKFWWGIGMRDKAIPPSLGGSVPNEPCSWLKPSDVEEPGWWLCIFINVIFSWALEFLWPEWMFLYFGQWLIPHPQPWAHWM